MGLILSDRLRMAQWLYVSYCTTKPKDCIVLINSMLRFQQNIEL